MICNKTMSDVINQRPYTDFSMYKDVDLSRPKTLNF